MALLQWTKANLRGFVGTTHWRAKLLTGEDLSIWYRVSGGGKYGPRRSVSFVLKGPGGYSSTHGSLREAKQHVETIYG